MPRRTDIESILIIGAGPIVIGHLVDYTGPTSDVGKPYGQGAADALAYINKNGGIAGRPLQVDMVDYSYNAPRAIATYKKWIGSDKIVAAQGWGTADTEALNTIVEALTGGNAPAASADSPPSTQATS